MTAGRRPIPTHLKLVTGTQRAGRANKAEPKPKAGRPRIPAHLSSYARLAWTTYAPLLEGMGVLTVPDALALERLCECYSEIRQHGAVLAREGLSYRPPVFTKDGLPILDAIGMPVLGKASVRPEVAAMADADRRFKGWLSEFGLTPAARTKVKVVPKDDDPDPAAGLLD